MSMKDEDRLAELGYKQELTRNWSLLHNFGVSFSIIVRYVFICFRPDPGGSSTSAIGPALSFCIASCIMRDAIVVEPMGQNSIDS